jgi:hypothetical protein
VLITAADVATASDYPREHIYDTSVGPDEALVNVSMTMNRWPDCTTLSATGAWCRN